MNWDRTPPATGYNVYFGLASRLATGHAGWCYAANLKSYAADLDVQPAPGELFWYLVTGRTAVQEGSVGKRSDGTVRPKPSACNDSLAADWDQDTALNALDNCRFDANQNQADRDKDGPGDVCDRFPGDPLNDAPDGDGVGTDVDNCPFVSRSGASRDQGRSGRAR